MLLIITKRSLEPSIKRQVVLDNEIEEWMKSSCAFKSDVGTPKSASVPRGASLRLIALEDPEHLDTLTPGSAGPLAVKKEIYRIIATHFEISPMFLTAALNRSSVYLKVGLALITNAGSDSFEAAPSIACRHRSLSSIRLPNSLNSKRWLLSWVNLSTERDENHSIPLRLARRGN